MVREQPLFGMAPLLARVRMQESAVASLGNTVNGSAESVRLQIADCNSPC